jgi:hypothetical protein
MDPTEKVKGSWRVNMKVESVVLIGWLMETYALSVEVVPG